MDPQIDMGNSELGKLQAIKEIIAGQDIKELKEAIQKLDQKFDKTLAGQNADLLSAIEKLSKDLNTRMEKSEASLEKKLEKLSEEKTDRKKLGSLLIKLGESLQK